ncbi:uncharacterized protein K452DRAFT_303756 [Aplosporella prunicola CBS 121167]|uniref:Uncharacterized protein n=1 Tax=Aplosporella prunicola CBS 121167 TaxID=1176127 RepID=A0A6A6AX72_9PEZI|nr:uncharacterized protein K452DRAFT_303756 [Aplosporella prunicola CBS 121167]KAF2135151.1 hypothetical protein K452DRAFT_303756 [Aplosporella prunicola CBS 121167]
MSALIDKHNKEMRAKDRSMEELRTQLLQQARSGNFEAGTDNFWKSLVEKNAQLEVDLTCYMTELQFMREVTIKKERSTYADFLCRVVEFQIECRTLRRQHAIDRQELKFQLAREQSARAKDQVDTDAIISSKDWQINQLEIDAAIGETEGTSGKATLSEHWKKALDDSQSRLAAFKADRDRTVGKLAAAKKETEWVIIKNNEERMKLVNQHHELVRKFAESERVRTLLAGITKELTKDLKSTRVHCAGLVNARDE